MTRKALARRIAELLFNEPATRRGAGAAPTRRGLRGFWPGALLLVGSRPPRVFSASKVNTTSRLKCKSKKRIIRSTPSKYVSINNSRPHDHRFFAETRFD